MTTSKRTSAAVPEPAPEETTTPAPPAPVTEPKYPTEITATREQLEALRAKLQRFH